jgi:hypothetical protein
MADHLGDLEAQCKAQSAIQQLCRSLSECQGKMCDGSGNCSGNGKGNGSGGQPGEGGGNGGLKPGTGSSSAINVTKDRPPASGERSVLKGIKGQGPSVSTTEAASDGSGSSLGSSAVQIQRFQHQAEAFVRREDVSEAVKAGVKAYFEGIHRHGDNPGQ